MNIDPIGIFLVNCDSKGQRVLFRYPYANNTVQEIRRNRSRSNPYALYITEDTSYRSDAVNLKLEHLSEFSDELLSTLFAVKPKFNGHKFELKINDIRFIGHPTAVQPYCGINAREGNAENLSTILVHVVFALRASADQSVAESYYHLSKRIGVAISHEEKRCGYFCNEMKLMMTALDSVEHTRTEDSREDVVESPFDSILLQCSLARNLKLTYDSLCSKGIVNFRMNNWIEISFCLTQKAHAVHIPNFLISPANIDKCLEKLKPFHGILLLEDIVTTLNSLPPDATPSLVRFLKVYSPVKNFQLISADSDLTLAQVFNLVGHFLHWGCAMIIYPLCESNVYVIAPGSSIAYHSELVQKFSRQFPGHGLIELMHEFSFPSTMSHKMNPLTHSQEQAVLVQMVAWMLRHRLLMQLHTYVVFMPTEKGMFQDTGAAPHARYHGLNELGPSGHNGHSGSDVDTCSTKGASESDVSSVVSEDLIRIPMTTFQTALSSWLNTAIADEGDKIDDFFNEDDFIATLTAEEKTALSSIPAISRPEDFHLLIRLLKQGYLQGGHHLEEIMYLENIRRSQLVQLIEKFQDILVTYECEDPAVAHFYPSVS